MELVWLETGTIFVVSFVWYAELFALKLSIRGISDSCYKLVMCLFQVFLSLSPYWVWLVL